LPDNLIVGGDLYLNRTQITILPDNLKVKGRLHLRETQITNYPVVYNCGYYNRAIYLDLTNKEIIRIGCFKGTREEAIRAIKFKYKSDDAEKYINKINECFDMLPDYKHTKLAEKDKK